MITIEKRRNKDYPIEGYSLDSLLSLVIWIHVCKYTKDDIIDSSFFLRLICQFKRTSFHWLRKMLCYHRPQKVHLIIRLLIFYRNTLKKMKPDSSTWEFQALLDITCDSVFIKGGSRWDQVYMYLLIWMASPN